MQRIAKFEKVSFEIFKRDWLDTFNAVEEIGTAEFVDEHIRMIYDNIELPTRSTSGSAGYDFKMPMSFTLGVGEAKKIPTGIRCKMNEGWVLLGFPRSGLGFKYGLHHANDIPVIDSDYYYSDNEGHVHFKMVNDSSLAKDIKFNAGDAFCQCVFVPFGITEDDNVETKRNGGFGSTSR